MSVNQKIENLSKETLAKAFKRLRKSTNNFTRPIVRDPLDNLDFQVNLDSNLNSIVYEINSGNYHPQRPFLHLSPKSKGINRPTVVFDIKDAIVYRFCLEQIEAELVKRTRQKNIRGGSKITPNRSSTGEDFYETWFEDWMAHQSSLEESLGRKKYLVTTDIASYFENINILVLKDLIMGDVTAKNGVLNLLFYFLESTRFRVDYEVNTFNGLPQEDIDCSRILAYYFLSSHDQRLIQFCKQYNGEFFRFVDDMSITIDSEVDGKWALKCISESLRKLNLVSSIEKTTILKSNDARSELFFDENRHLTKLEDDLIQKLLKGENIKPISLKIERYYIKLLKNKRDLQKNWIKVLRRFYSLFILAKSSFLFNKLLDHLKTYPLIFAGNKVSRYLLLNSSAPGFNKAIVSLINYLYSEDNLYPATESNLLEILLLIDPASYNSNTTKRLKQLGWDIFFGKNDYRCLSKYAKALSCLLIYKFDSENLHKVGRYYLRLNDNDSVLKKYIIFVSLTIDNIALREKVLNKARSEQNLSINRLVNLIDNMGSYKDYKQAKAFLNNDKVVIAYSKKPKYIVELKVDLVRPQILKRLIDIYS